MKKLAAIRTNAERHWVGDGFPVRTIFSYDDIAQELSPFLMLDYAGPAVFPPTEQRLGVGEHPHRGFETVTIVYEGEVEHRDSSGGGGVIRKGDVQWMTAASGVVHEEFHGPEFSKKGGPFEMVQLWVNLPKAHKMTSPGYQGIQSSQIPRIDLPDGAGWARVIAGELDGRLGPARTFSPLNLWDLSLNRGKKLELRVAEGHTAALFVLKGKLGFSGGKAATEAELAVLERDGDAISAEILDDSRVLLLSGKPLNEPIVGYGPFVMSTEQEIHQAFSDYRSGKMGSFQRSIK